MALTDAQSRPGCRQSLPCRREGIEGVCKVPSHLARTPTPKHRALLLATDAARSRQPACITRSTHLPAAWT